MMTRYHLRRTVTPRIVTGMANTAQDTRTLSTGGTYHHTYECDVFTLGSAVMVLLEADFDLTLENLHKASFGTRDAYPHRTCYHNCARLRLGQIETELERTRKRARAAGIDSAAMEEVRSLVAERTAIRQEVDA